MARIRSLKPEAFTSETLAGCSVHARWTFAGLWTYVDDDGRGRANAGLIKAAVWPLDDDVSGADVGRLLDELEAEHLICRYEVDGKSYLHVVNFGEHQHPNRPLASKLPACSRKAHGGLSEPSVTKHSGAPAGSVAPASASSEAKTGKSGRRGSKAAGQGSLTEDAVSSHGGRTTKSSSTPPTPLRNELGEVDGEGGEVQQATPAVAGDEESPGQRANRLTKTYTDQVKISNFPAAAKIVRKAIDADCSDEQIITALKLLITENRSLTTDSLRIAIYGPPNGERTPTTTQRVQSALSRAARYEQEESP